MHDLDVVALSEDFLQSFTNLRSLTIYCTTEIVGGAREMRFEVKPEMVERLKEVWSSKADVIELVPGWNGEPKIPHHEAGWRSDWDWYILG